MLEADLDASPRTLRFFTDGYDRDEILREQPIFVTHIPQSINFAVCDLLILRFFISLQVSSRDAGNSFSLSLREVATCAGCRCWNSKPRQWGTDWPASWI
jgi:hypothetical protein